MAAKKRMVKKMKVARPRSPVPADIVPATFFVADWPPGVVPGTPARGSFFVRCHAKELAKCGALIRIGKSRVIISKNYMRWLSNQKHRDAVLNYTPPGLNKENQNDEA